MATPVSGSTPYCSVEDLFDLVDWRTLMQLMGDKSGPSNPIRNTLMDEDSVEGGRILKILKVASGEVEGAVGVGGGYTPSDLAALTGNSAEFLKCLVRDLAVFRAYRRRPNFGPMPPEAEEARNMLNAIASGANVLGLQENMDAGRMELTTDTVCDPVTRNGIVVQAEGYFGHRSNRRHVRGCGPNPGCGPCW